MVHGGSSSSGSDADDSAAAANLVKEEGREGFGWGKFEWC